MIGSAGSSELGKLKSFTGKVILTRSILIWKSIFDTVSHDVLMERVSCKVKNKCLLRLLGSFLRAGVEIKGRLQPTRLGVPQGSPVSPILSNILLDDLDKGKRSRNHFFSIPIKFVTISATIILLRRMRWQMKNGLIDVIRKNGSGRFIFAPGKKADYLRLITAAGIS